MSKPELGVSSSPAPALQVADEGDGRGADAVGAPRGDLKSSAVRLFRSAACAMAWASRAVTHRLPICWCTEHGVPEAPGRGSTHGAQLPGADATTDALCATSVHVCSMDAFARPPLGCDMGVIQ